MFPQTPHIECVALLEQGRLMARGFGVAAGLDREVASPLAGRCQELGYASMWSNDHPGAKGLETLADFAAGADRIDLGVAVIALDRHGPDEIAADLERLELDRERLWLGVGAGFTKKPLTTMREALPELREALPGVQARPRRDGPEDVRPRGSRVRRRLLQLDDPGVRGRARARTSRRAPPRPAASRRRSSATSAPPSATDSEQRLAKEESFYRDLHKGYRDHFDRLGEPEGTVGVAAQNAGEAQTELAPLPRPRHRRGPRPRERERRGHERGRRGSRPGRLKRAALIGALAATVLCVGAR